MKHATIPLADVLALVDRHISDLRERVEQHKRDHGRREGQAQQNKRRGQIRALERLRADIARQGGSVVEQA